MRRLVVTADDFGLSPGVNRGILRGHLQGVVTAASLMANLPHARAAVRLARCTPTLDVGIHLNLTGGFPVSDAGLLTRPDGRFRPVHEIALRTAFSDLARRQAIDELRAQIERALDWGLTPSHLDGHHHVHVLPQLLGDVLGFADRLGAAVRRPREPIGLAPSFAQLRELTVGILSSMLADEYSRRGVRTTDAFVGYRLRGAGFTPAAVLASLAHQPGTSTELMAHPAEVDDEIYRWTSYGAGRDTELTTLCDVHLREALEEQDWTLAGWRAIPNR